MSTTSLVEVPNRAIESSSKDANNISPAEFLSAFFPDENEEIRLRAFPPRGASGGKRKILTSRGRLLNDQDLQHDLLRLNRECGMYFVVNSGGDEDKDIKRFNAFMVESDTLSIPEQHAALDAAPIPPSIRNETRKSVHAYWLIKGECSEEQWRDVQRRLIAYFKGDPAIKNPSRVMRLPGFDHIFLDKADGSVARRKVSCTEFKPIHRYTVAEMQANYEAVETRERKLSATRRVEHCNGQSNELLFDADAEPPAEKFQALYANNRLFAKAWDLQRPEFDGDASRYDQSLANIAATAEWGQQEILNLLIAFRRKHQFDLKFDNRQYYTVQTIPKAYEYARNNNETRSDTSAPITSVASDLGLTRELADAITESDQFAQDVGGLLYVFKGGTYLPRGDRHIVRRVKELLNRWGQSKSWTSYRAKEVVLYIQADAPVLWQRPPLDVINVENGLLNVKTRELSQHSADFLSPIQLPVRFDPTATCEAWDDFALATFPEDVRNLALEIPAWLMTPDTSLQKAILLLGEGANGKSTYLAALTEFIGKPHTTAISLQKLESDRFAAARLVGKLANLCPDLPSTHLESTAMFKAITGGDTVTGENKFKTSFEFTPYARLIFSANHAPRSKDSSQGFFRRWVVIPFERIFDGAVSGEIPRRILDAKLADPRQLSGVFNRALDFLPKLREKGITEAASTRTAFDEFREATDPFAVWLNRATVEAPDMVVKKGLLIEQYEKACEREGRPRMTKQAFGRAFKRCRPHITEAQRTFGNKPEWVWIGIGLKA